MKSLSFYISGVFKSSVYLRQRLIYLQIPGDVNAMSLSQWKSGPEFQCGTADIAHNLNRFMQIYQL